jgi:phospholipase D1/2
LGIARTQPAYHGRAEAREVTHLFMDVIRAAQHSIYIENQFVTSEKIARCLASRLRENRDLEVLIVAPRRYESWIEAKTMRNARIRFWQIVKEAGGERVRLMYPDVAQDGKSTCTMIHSKVMVVDDWFLRIGSANMNDRSMGADSECDLAIEAQTPAERAAILDIRNRLLGEHCGLSTAATARALGENGQSMLAVADRVSGNGHSLRPIDDGEPENSELLRYLEEIADPPEPLKPSKVGQRLIGHLRNAGGGAAFKVALVALLAGALTLAWQGSPLADWVEVKKVGQWLRVAGSQPWGGGIVVAGFILGGLVCFPVTVLIAATAAVFGPWYGFAYAFLGVIGSALTTYGIGFLFGRSALQQMLGEKLDKLHARLKAQGVLAIAAIRAIPIAPFTIVNLAAGATGIRLTDYVAGTVLGMLPGLVVMAVLGHQIVALVSNPSIRELSLLAIGIAGWVLLTLGVQKLISMQWRSGR